MNESRKKKLKTELGDDKYLNTSTGDFCVIVKKIDLYRQVIKKHAQYRVVYEGNESFQKILFQEFFPNAKSPMHIHKNSSEMVIVLKGCLFIETNEITVTIPELHTAIIPAGVPHCFINKTDDTPIISILLLGENYSSEEIVENNC